MPSISVKCWQGYSNNFLEWMNLCFCPICFCFCFCFCFFFCRMVYSNRYILQVEIWKGFIKGPSITLDPKLSLAACCNLFRYISYAEINSNNFFKNGISNFCEKFKKILAVICSQRWLIMCWNDFLKNLCMLLDQTRNQRLKRFIFVIEESGSRERISWWDR